MSCVYKPLFWSLNTLTYSSSFFISGFSLITYLFFAPRLCNNLNLAFLRTFHVCLFNVLIQHFYLYTFMLYFSVIQLFYLVYCYLFLFHLMVFFRFCFIFLLENDIPLFFLNFLYSLSIVIFIFLDNSIKKNR